MDAAFDGFFDEHYDPIVRSLTMVLGDRTAAEDAAELGFERAYRKWRVVAELERPGTWVYVVALRGARRQMRREATRPAPPILEATEFEEGAVASMTVRAALADLPLRQRAAVVLRYLAGLSVAEVATAMGCAEGTVKATLHHALARLRVDLAEEVGIDAS